MHVPQSMGKSELGFSSVLQSDLLFVCQCTETVPQIKRHEMMEFCGALPKVN